MPMHFPGSDRAMIRARSIAPLPTIAYGCDPVGRANWNMLNSIYKAPKVGPVGACKVFMKVSNLSEGETSLCKELDCGRMVVVTNLAC